MIWKKGTYVLKNDTLCVNECNNGFFDSNLCFITYHAIEYPVFQTDYELLNYEKDKILNLKFNDESC